MAKKLVGKVPIGLAVRLRITAPSIFIETSSDGPNPSPLTAIIVPTFPLLRSMVAVGSTVKVWVGASKGVSESVAVTVCSPRVVFGTKNVSDHIPEASTITSSRVTLPKVMLATELPEKPVPEMVKLLSGIPLVGLRFRVWSDA